MNNQEHQTRPDELHTTHYTDLKEQSKEDGSDDLNNSFHSANSQQTTAAMRFDAEPFKPTENLQYFSEKNPASTFDSAQEGDTDLKKEIGQEL